MTNKALRADALLLFTALIWGLAFVAQRVGMDFMGPLTFNGLRFALGSLALWPVVMRAEGMKRLDWRAGALTGVLLFAGAALQQMGVVYTEAGKAGFITGLYVVLVPLVGVFLGRRAGGATWLGACLALSGLYLLSVTGDFALQRGDALVLLSALVWTLHVLVIDRYAGQAGALRLAWMQFTLTAALSLGGALLFEQVDPRTWGGALWPVLYAGMFSVGIGYTLQVVAQKDAPPAHAAILLSLEAVFAVIGGWVLLGEVLTRRGLLGSALMLAGMWVSQAGRTDDGEG